LLPKVAALAVYGYFAICLLGHQYIDQMLPNDALNALNPILRSAASRRIRVDYIIPLFTIIEFFFYVGWFKVGQQLTRPFEDYGVCLNMVTVTNEFTIR
jgi:hypothetical protein